MGPAKDAHDNTMILDHVGKLAGLRTGLDNIKETVLNDRKEVDKMGTRLGIVEKDLTVLKVKIATYSTIAVFIANLAYNIVSKWLGA
jgi:hypothetical protein